MARDTWTARFRRADASAPPGHKSRCRRWSNAAMNGPWSTRFRDRQPGLSLARGEWVLACGARYWPGGDPPIRQLPIAIIATAPAPGAARTVELPDWARD